MWRPSGVTPLNDCIQKSSNKNHSWLKLKWSRIQWVSEQKNQRLSLKRCNKLDHPWWLTIQSLWGMSQLLKIITRRMIQWESNWMKKKIRMNIQQGWRHHADLPLPGVQNSHPMLSIMAQPRQGSWRVDTWRKQIQQCLQTKYNCPVRFCTFLLVWLSITWVVAEKGKGDKSHVWQNENLNRKKAFSRTGWISHVLHYLTPITWRM